MKWLLWGLVVLVLASLASAFIAMSVRPNGAVLAVGIGLLPFLLLVGAVLGLVSLKWRKVQIYAGILLLAPVAFVVATAIGEMADAGEGYAEAVYMPMAEAETWQASLQWLNWAWWLNLAAVVLALVSALLLFRNATPARRTADRPDQQPG